MFSSFMLPIWAETSIVALTAGIVGFFVVLRGATFAAHAIPQGAFTGAAGATLAGIATAPGIGLFSLVAVLAIARWGRRDRHDVITALTLVMLLATGSLFLGLGPEYAQQTYALLFGEPLATGIGDLLPTAIAAALCIGACLAMQRRFMLSALGDELAAARGVKSGSTQLVFLLVLGGATTLALPIVGALLVFSLMIGPPAAARSLSNQPGRALALSGLFSVATGWAALAGSYWWNWPVGFFVGVLGAFWYALGRGARRAGNRNVLTVGSDREQAGPRRYHSASGRAASLGSVAPVTSAGGLLTRPLSTRGRHASKI